MPASRLLLPRGLYDTDGRCHREAALRPLTGHQELEVADCGRLDAATTSALLSRCLSAIGAFEPATEAHAHALTRGDRHFLLLRLRALLFGSRVPLVVTCSNPDCGEPADMIVDVEELAPERPEVTPTAFEVDTAGGPLWVREPTGADDALLEGTEGTHHERSAVLWSQLVCGADGTRLSVDAWRALPGPSRHRVALTLAARTAAPDLALVSRCPSCRAWLELVLDPSGLLANDLRLGADRLFAEVHVLAFWYHWDEQRILDLPRSRRWRYLELVRRQVEGRPLVGVEAVR